MFHASLMLLPDDSDNKTTNPRTGGTPNTWKAPPRGFMKLNTDASICDLGGTGFGAIIRNEAGILIVASTRCIEPVHTPQVAEALCLRWGILMARDQGIQDLIVETDCLQLKQAWNRTEPHNNHMDMLIQDCKSLSSSFRNLHVTHCCRTTNVVADLLAHMAFDFQDNLWRATNPLGTTQLLQQDTIQCNVSEVSW